MIQVGAHASESLNLAYDGNDDWCSRGVGCRDRDRTGSASRGVEARRSLVKRAAVIPRVVPALWLLCAVRSAAADLQ